jgi:hypothetical protein
MSHHATHVCVRSEGAPLCDSLSRFVRTSISCLHTSFIYYCSYTNHHRISARPRPNERKSSEAHAFDAHPKFTCSARLTKRRRLHEGAHTPPFGAAFSSTTGLQNTHEGEGDPRTLHGFTCLHAHTQWLHATQMNGRCAVPVIRSAVSTIIGRRRHHQCDRARQGRPRHHPARVQPCQPARAVPLARRPRPHLRRLAKYGAVEVWKMQVY